MFLLNFQVKQLTGLSEKSVDSLLESLVSGTESTTKKLKKLQKKIAKLNILTEHLGWVLVYENHLRDQKSMISQVLSSGPKLYIEKLQERFINFFSGNAYFVHSRHNCIAA